LLQVNGPQNGDENIEPSAKRRKLLRGSMDDGKILTAELVVYDKHTTLPGKRSVLTKTTR
jgi:hypothetical protein